jgi:LCP family protein required for cell wall assembly
MALLIITGITGVALRALTSRYDDTVTKERLLDPFARKEQKDGRISGPLNYLLIGSDQRPRNPDAGERADTIMIAHVPEGLDRAYLISVPRDLLVQIPPHPPSGYEGGEDKINSAFQFGRGGQGGTQLVSATLTRMTGIRFDGAAIINFGGFRKVIDLVGGVEVCLDREVRSIHTGNVYPAGCQEMNGAEALDFARQRYGLPEGDFDRQRHQQQLLRALLDRISNTKLLADPLKADQILREVGSALTLDTNGVPTEDLVVGLRDLRPDALSGIRLPSHSETINANSYTLLDGAAVDLFRAVRDADVESWAKANPRWVNDL